MNKLTKKMFILDERTIKAILLLAAEETNGNQSAAIRLAVREAAKARNLWPNNTEPKTE